MTSILGQAKADFLERTRRFSFMAMIALSLFGAFFFVPSTEVGSMSFLSIMPEVFFQSSNATWIPVASAMGTGFFLSLIGLFYLRTSISFDEKIGVDQLIVVSPVKNTEYLLGKFLSGTLLLFIFAIITIIGSFIMALIHFPQETLSVRTILAPYAFLMATLPMTSAFALFFGSFRWLRGSIGSTIYVFGIMFLIDAILDVNEAPRTLTLFQRSIDFTGMIYLQNIIKFGVYDVTGSYVLTNYSFLGGFNADIAVNPTEHLFFVTMPFGANELVGFLLMLVYACIIIILSAPFLSLSRRFQGKKLFGKYKIESVLPVDSDRVVPNYFATKITDEYNWIAGTVVELKLMLKGQPIMWKAVSAVGFGVSIFLDLGTVQVLIIPLLMLWFINVFSGMGYKEHHYDMFQLISVMPKGRFRQVTCSYVAGLFIASILLLPVTLRMFMVSQFEGVVVAISAVIFIPSLAMFLGEFTRTNRSFEMLLIMLTYLILNKIHFINYVGFHPDIVSVTRGMAFLVVGIVIGVFAVVRRLEILKI